jgi:hypothetical protein
LAAGISDERFQGSPLFGLKRVKNAVAVVIHYTACGYGTEALRKLGIQRCRGACRIFDQPHLLREAEQMSQLAGAGKAPGHSEIVGDAKFSDCRD